jgi:outer membrane murein-binding lipoprotein Lpp
MRTKNREKTSTLICVLVAAVVSLLLLPGCVSSHKVQTQSASVGQQLQDLDKSYKDGLITQKEYEKLKKAIIKAND